MTDITLGLPIGGFYWRGGVPGPLCGATVSWTCDYASTEPVAIPPFIDFFGPNVVVTNILPECESIPSYVSPGVLTLTPTVTCPNPDPEGDPIVTVLDPLYLTITEGTCGSSAPEPPCVPTICPFPENPGFESGGLSGWNTYNATLDTVIVHTGTYSVKLAQYGYVWQKRDGACPDAPSSFDVSFYVYCPNADSTARLQVIQYDGTTTVDNYIQSTIPITPGVWNFITYSPQWHPDMDTIRVQVEANHPDIYVDDIAVSFCP